MDRRSALKQMAIAAGGIALLPSCNFGPERVAVALNNLQLDVKQQDLLARICEIIIPSSEDSPGAESLDLYRFVLVMVDDCHATEEQNIFANGLKQVEVLANEQLDKSFSHEDKAANEVLFGELMNLEGVSEALQPTLQDVQAFLALTKRYTIQGYLSSEYVMTEKFPYKLVPGPYQACVSTEGLTVM
jgi:hypothetical protein